MKNMIYKMTNMGLSIKHNTCRCAVLLLLLYVCSSTAVLAQADTNRKEGVKNIIVQPVTLDYALSPGQVGNKKIKVVNNLGKKLQFKVYLSDWSRDSIGGHLYVKPGTLSNSCSNWITLDKSFLELDAGEGGEINVKLTVPDGPDVAKQMKWTMLFVETVEEKVTPNNEKGLTSIVNTKMRVGVHVCQTPPGLTNREIRITSFVPIAGKKNEYRIICSNTGDIQTECKSYLELSSLADSKTTRLDARVFPTFPGQTRFVDFALPDTLPKGKYNIVAAVDIGDDVPLEAVQSIIEMK